MVSVPLPLSVSVYGQSPSLNVKLTHPGGAITGLRFQRGVFGLSPGADDLEIQKVVVLVVSLGLQRCLVGHNFPRTCCLRVSTEGTPSIRSNN